MSERDELQSWIDDASESLDRRVAARAPRRSFADVMRRADGIGESELADGDLMGFVTDAREALDRRIDDGPRSGSFDDVMTRAHVVEPTTVDDEKIAEARCLAPVVDLQRRSAGERALGVFVEDARAGVVARISTRSRPTAEPAERAESTRTRTRTVAGLLAVAAIAVFAIAWAVGLPDVLEQQRAHGLSDGEQSQHIEDGEQPQGASRDEPERAVEKARASALEPIETLEPEPPTLPRARSAVRVPAPSLADLAALAKTQWRAGELEAAEQTLTRIVERGASSRWADNAFSDLFALSHRRGDARAQQRWWKAYLRRFPRGRFADDAQAGLCRASAKRVCWATYLERFPEGSYRAEARRMVDGE